MATVARGTHHLRVVGYEALLSRASPGVSIASAPFHVGGYGWAIRFFPAGKDATDVGRVAIVVELVSDAPHFAKAWYHLDVEEDPFFDDEDDAEPANPVILGSGMLKRWVFRPESRFIEPKDDCITVCCSVEVRAAESGAALPPPSMPDHLLQFLETKPARDIVFQVEDREFEAHFRVFRVRARSFNVTNFGPLEGDGFRMYCTVDDMKADVFEAIKQFVYTDEMPAEVQDLLGCVSAADKARLRKKVRKVLAAAHRFGLDRLAFMCEKALHQAFYLESMAPLQVLG
ncbi:hypothetical protein EJB05_01736, partial [Eragrostis curvula]